MNDKSSKDSQNKKPELKAPPVRPIQVTANTRKPASNRSIKKKKTIGKLQSKWDGKDCPIWQEKEDIISAISTHKIVVLTAPPATGKSTQLPLMMLEAGFKRVVLVVPRYIIADQIKNDISRLLEGIAIEAKIRT